MKKNEIIIARKNELQNGQMKKVRIHEDKEVLLIRLDDQFYAGDTICPHYGAPLERGALSGKKLMCPWHHAVFEIPTGLVCDPPALNGLAGYKLQVRGEDIILFLEEGEIQEKEDESKGKKRGKDDRSFVIIGGGAAGNAAARQLRTLGYNGRIQIISADSQPPYDRPNLSKDYLRGDMDPDWLPLNEKDFFKEKQIELMLEKQVMEVDPVGKQIVLDNRTKLRYDRLLIASGGLPRRLNVPGIDLDNIFTLRTLNDAENILKQAEKAERITVIGASFIGMETAENLNNGKREIHIIALEEMPFGHLFGNDVGMMLKEKKENSGIHFHLGRSVSEFRGNGKIEEIGLDNQEYIKTDLAILGIGVEPRTSFLPQFKKATDRSLITDEYLQVEKDVFAAGDMTTFPYWKSGDLIRIEHWRVAEQHGFIAANNMLGLNKKVEIIPFFWTNLAGMEFRYVGYPGKWDYSIIQGDLFEENFIIYYIFNNRVNAALGVGQDEQMTVIELLLSAGKMPSAEILKSKEMTAEKLRELI